MGKERDRKMEKQESTTFNSAKELIERLSDLASVGKYVFRGYNTNEQLKPNLIRKRNMQNVEDILLRDFEKYGSSYFPANTAIDLLSCGQHYGLPTRLLDFTCNPFIALRFALFSQKGSKYNDDEERDYYFIRYCNLDDNLHLNSIPTYHSFTFGAYRSDSLAKRTIDLLKRYSECMNDMNSKDFNSYIRGLYECDFSATESLEEYSKTVCKKIENKKICFIEPSQSNQRIVMQQGLFMLPYTLDEKEHMEIIRNNTAVIKVHKDLRKELLRYLDTLGFNTFRLMPDLANICVAIDQQIKDDNLLQKNTNKNQVAKNRDKIAEMVLILVEIKIQCEKYILLELFLGHDIITI